MSATATMPFAPATTKASASVPGVFFAQAAKYEDRPYLRYWSGEELHVLSWKETAERAMRIACALIAEGLWEGDHVALMSPNRVEWIYCDFAIMAAGGVTVPIYPSLPS